MPESLRRASIGARAFAAVALAVPLALNPQREGLIALGILVVAWGIACLDPLPTTVLRTVLEAAVVATCCAFALQDAPLVLAALVVVPFVAGLGRGLWGVSAALSTELVIVVGFALADGQVTQAQMLETFSWLMTGVGLGLVASFVHSVMVVEEDPLGAYREARSLIKELLSVSQDLTSGLDAVSLGGEILAYVRDVVPTVALAVHVPHDGELTTLVSEGDSADERAATLAEEVVGNGRVRFQGRAFAFPLIADSDLVAVVGGTLSEDFDASGTGLIESVYRLPEELLSTSVRLDTALLFAALKHQATAEERGRWAREMHDGVAQDIAYLGYAVDALAAQATTEQQQEQLQDLRRRITGVVAEVRRSVLTLRTQVGASESLGAGLGRLARHLSDVSGIPIQVTVDERTTRAAPRGRGGAPAHRPGGHEQRGQAQPGLPDRRELPGRPATGGAARQRRRSWTARSPQRLARAEDHEGAGPVDRRRPGGPRPRRRRSPGQRAHRTRPGRSRARHLPCGARIGDDGPSMSEQQTLRVLLVDDHELVRHGLATVFAAHGVEVVGQAGTVAEALRVFAETRPEAIVTDLQLPDGTGLDIVRAVRRESADTGLVILTMHSGDEQIFAAMEAGASAFVGKDAPVGRGGPGGATRGRFAAQLHEHRPGRCGDASLRTRRPPACPTVRWRCSVLLADGLGTSAIASRLYMSESTVKSHIAQIYTKMGASNRAQALVTAMRRGLLVDHRPAPS